MRTIPDEASDALAAHPFAPLVAERDGAIVGSLDDLRAGSVAGARFVALLVRDERLLPAIAKLSPAQAGADPARGASEVDAYLIKAGMVGGPEGSPGARPVGAALIAAVLDADRAREVEWEEDPDFGYLVAAGVPGIDPPDEGLLLPRLLYTRNGRVYEHASLVAEARERGELPSRLAGGRD